MNKESCLNFQQLIHYVINRSAKEFSEIEQHLAACKSCLEEFNYLNKLYDKLTEKGRWMETDFQTKEGEIHVSDELRERYFQGSLSQSKIDTIHRHLAGCPECYREFTSVSRGASYELSPQEKDLVDQIEDAEVDDRVSEYKSNFRLPKKEGKDKRLFQLIPDVRLRWASVAFAVLLFIAYFGYPFVAKQITFNQAEQAFAALENKVKIAEDDLRPTGDFQFTRIGAVRGRSSHERLLSDFESIRKAVELDPQSVKFNHYAGTVHFFTGNLDKAEEYYLKALSLDERRNAEIYNDLALVDVERNDFQQAKMHLERALELNPTLPEAQYNLAVIAEQMGETDVAIKAWEKYLKLDPDPQSDWNKVARTHLQQLREK
ncbi:tetratricopeptide repeat protein [candidate division KSB1 bacterium]|nr:tetratricopeptide repeat protein [candidate division KSB1 bacterium]NIR71442.1 tetratricopeptide repeat protein [candidate division KSB1 bacterium]NIS23363.1 tetratricopeptide repeat protein [candidate division KSB1 bacterium]NIT70254.1 tetratricopeptide repeat protein [candidate division KSB1 bacterium]NIU23977.1 tetratricopeptide repeat protein [candidate division KSB1 bacterium]